MKSRFILFRRAGVFYAEETATGKQTSLRTKDEAEALTLLNTKNEATRQPAMNLQIAQVYLQHADATMAQRTWQDGHTSKAFVRAYSRKAKVVVPSLEDYEAKIVPMQAAVNQ